MEKTIDIEKILTSKLGGKARLVPRCLINWLRKIAHEDQVNQFLYDHRDEVGTQWLTSTVEYLKMHITIEGEENLPSKDDGKLYTFVSTDFLFFLAYHHIPSLHYQIFYKHYKQP